MISAKVILMKYGQQDPSGEVSKLLQTMKGLLDERRQKMSNLICKELSDARLSAQKIYRNIEWLVRLDLGLKARDVFLSTRSTILQRRIRSLTFDGDTVQYISDLAYIVFTMIKNTCEWYKRLFKEPQASSGFIKWIKQELERYAQIFRCQVFHDTQQRFSVIRDCINITADNCRVLIDVGVEIGFLFDFRIFRQDVAQSIELLRVKEMSLIAKAIADEDFSLTAVSPLFSLKHASTDKSLQLQRTLKLSRASCVFVETLLNYLFKELSPLLQPPASQIYYTEVVESVAMFFEMHYRHLMDHHSGDAEMTDTQQLGIVGDLHFLAIAFFPFLLHVFEGCAVVGDGLEEAEQLVGFQRTIPEWQKMIQRCEAMVSMQLNAFYSRRSKSLAKSTFAFGKHCLPAACYNSWESLVLDYSNDAYPILDTAYPSDSMMRCVASICQLAVAVEEFLESSPNNNNDNDDLIISLPFDRKSVLVGVVEQFLGDMMNGKYYHFYYYIS